MEPEINDGAYICTEELEAHEAAMIMPDMTEDEFSELKSDILGNGVIFPIILFGGKILDGRHRYRACKELEIDVWVRDWEGGMDPVEYVISTNLKRRHLGTGQRAFVAQRMMEYIQRRAKDRQISGLMKGKEISPVVENLPQRTGKSRDEAGALLGVSGKAVDSARKVIEKGTPEQVKDLTSGKRSLNAIVKEVDAMVVEKEQKARPVFNHTSDSVEWAQWTWNPVTGCKHGCKYCYAVDIAKRFFEDFEPRFYPERLAAPENTPMPKKEEPGSRNVFVCSMADLFGDWVPQEWIDQVLDAVRNSKKDWRYIFLTKNPKRLIGIDFPENAWVGTTIDTQERVEAAEEAFAKVTAPVKFISCEPLLGDLKFSRLNLFDWVIIGGQSSSASMPAAQPKYEWVLNLLNQAWAAECMVYWKPNLITPKQYPRG